MQERLVVVGSANVDLVWRGERLPRPGETVSDGELVRVMGGKGANQACAAARLGARVAFVGCVGDDDLGAAVRADLDRHGIDCAWLAVAAGTPTGVALITVDAQGENSIAVAPGANHSLTTDHVRAALRAMGDVPVLTGLEIGEAAASTAIDAATGPVTFNPAPVDAAAASWFGRCAAVVVNEGEAAGYGVTPETAANVVVTHGRHGARDAYHDCAGFAVDAVDSTGAGDVFCAAYALTRDVAFATAAGALACRALGARASQPTRDEVESLLTAQPRSR